MIHQHISEAFNGGAHLSASRNIAPSRISNAPAKCQCGSVKVGWMQQPQPPTSWVLGAWH